MQHKISIIIPVLNEADTITNFLQHLQVFRLNGHELILVDGKSQDNTTKLALPLVDHLIVTDKGRARQQDAGAKVASGQCILFLHADTKLPQNADQTVLNALTAGNTWGRFNVCLSGQQTIFRIIEFFMNWRSCLTGIATGDQAIFVTRELYDRVGGMPLIELMEDIELSKRLKKLTRPACIKEVVTTSSRRWEQNGIVKTILLMWSLRLQYFFGSEPARLHKKYYS